MRRSLRKLAACGPKNPRPSSGGPKGRAALFLEGSPREEGRAALWCGGARTLASFPTALFLYGWRLGGKKCECVAASGWQGTAVRS